MPRVIMHLDMDAFFASIEERERPELRGKPIVVGADPKGGHGRGVVSTASYAARKFGIHSAMPISKAWKLCPAPKCAYLPVDGRLYEIVSQRVMRIVRECVGHALMEQVSVDEAYIEMKNVECRMKNCWEGAEEMARKIKREILEREKLTCSIGIGPNKLIAKIASDFQKPDGLTIVREGEAADFLAPLLIRRLPGIGPKTEAVLKKQGITTIGDLRLSLPQDDELLDRVWGIDHSPVVEQYDAKSLGHEITFAQDTRDQAMLTHTLMELCNEVIAEVAREGVRFKTITVRVRFDNFETHTSAFSLSTATDSGTILRQTALKLLFPYFKTKRLIRLIGVRVSRFERR